MTAGSKELLECMGSSNKREHHYGQVDAMRRLNLYRPVYSVALKTTQHHRQSHRKHSKVGMETAVPLKSSQDDSHTPNRGQLQGATTKNHEHASQ